MADNSWVDYANVSDCEALTTYLAKIKAYDPEIAKDKRRAAALRTRERKKRNSGIA
jgi:hypothetical protein